MAVQRKSQIPKAPERNLVDSIVAGPGYSPAATPQVDARPSPTPRPAQPQTLHPPVRKQRKPVRMVYTSKMDPDLKDWASSFKPEEDFLEVVEQALWILRLARSGKMTEAFAALEQSAQPPQA